MRSEFGHACKRVQLPARPGLGLSNRSPVTGRDNRTQPPEGVRAPWCLPNTHAPSRTSTLTRVPPPRTRPPFAYSHIHPRTSTHSHSYTLIHSHKHTFTPHIHTHIHTPSHTPHAHTRSYLHTHTLTITNHTLAFIVTHSPSHTPTHSHPQLHGRTHMSLHLTHTVTHTPFHMRTGLSCAPIGIPLWPRRGPTVGFWPGLDGGLGTLRPAGRAHPRPSLSPHSDPGRQHCSRPPFAGGKLRHRGGRGLAQRRTWWMGASSPSSLTAGPVSRSRRDTSTNNSRTRRGAGQPRSWGSCRLRACPGPSP